MRTHMPGKQEQWFLIKHQDQAARPESEYDVVQAEPNSVLSDRTLVPKRRGKAAAAKAVKQPEKGRAGEIAKRRRENHPQRRGRRTVAGHPQAGTGNTGGKRARRRVAL
nr:hypothetical protein GCM10020185_76660 [Pseudomonas brassicacearum subsp. brassicacearum]